MQYPKHCPMLWVQNYLIAIRTMAPPPRYSAIANEWTRMSCIRRKKKSRCSSTQFTQWYRCIRFRVPRFESLERIGIVFRWKIRQFETKCVTERQRTNIYCSVAASTKCWNRPSRTDIRNSWYHHSLQQRNEMDRFAHASVICAFPLETICGFLLSFFCFILFSQSRHQPIAVKINRFSSAGAWSVIHSNLYNSWTERVQPATFRESKNEYWIRENRLCVLARSITEMRAFVCSKWWKLSATCNDIWCWVCMLDSERNIKWKFQVKLIPCHTHTHTRKYSLIGAALVPAQRTHMPT